MLSHYLFFSFLIVSCDTAKDKTIILPIGNPNISVKVTKSTAGYIPTAVLTPLDFDVETYDTDNMHDNATNPSRLTVNTPGLYLIQGTVAFASSGSGFLGCHLRLNSATVIESNMINDLNSGGGTYLTISAAYNLIAGDYIELLAEQTSGSDLLAGWSISNFSMARLSESE
jgi:hypothetical protein